MTYEDPSSVIHNKQETSVLSAEQLKQAYMVLTRNIPQLQTWQRVALLEKIA